MAKLRPELTTSRDNAPCPRGGTALLLIYNAVRQRSGLIHGKLDNDAGDHCAIGCYFDDHEQTALPSELIDEVALVNDSVPRASERQRKQVVLRWLRWRLAQVGMPGFARYKGAQPCR